VIIVSVSGEFSTPLSQPVIVAVMMMNKHDKQKAWQEGRLDVDSYWRTIIPHALARARTSARDYGLGPIQLECHSFASWSGTVLAEQLAVETIYMSCRKDIYALYKAYIYCTVNI